LLALGLSGEGDDAAAPAATLAEGAAAVRQAGKASGKLSGKILPDALPEAPPESQPIDTLLAATGNLDIATTPDSAKDSSTPGEIALLPTFSLSPPPAPLAIAVTVSPTVTQTPMSASPI